MGWLFKKKFRFIKDDIFYYTEVRELFIWTFVPRSMSCDADEAFRLFEEIVETNGRSAGAKVLDIKEGK